MDNNKKFEEAFQKVIMGYETTNGKQIVQNKNDDKGNWVDGKNVGTAYGISGATLNRVFFERADFDDGTRNPYYLFFDPTGNQKHITTENVRAVTQEQAKNIAFHNYWNPIQGDNLSDKMAVPVFDAAFHNGNVKAINQLQANLASANLYDGVVSGKMNHATISAVNNVDQNVLYNFYHDARVQGYEGSSSPYKQSFINRVNQEFPKDVLTPDQQAQYKDLATLKSLQEYVKTELGPNQPIKADGIWGKETEKAIAQVGGSSPGHTISPALQQDFSKWYSQQPHHADRLIPSVATHSIATHNVSAPSIAAQNVSISAAAASASSINQVSSSAISDAGSSSASSGISRQDNLNGSGSNSSSGSNPSTSTSASTGSSSSGGI